MKPIDWGNPPVWVVLIVFAVVAGVACLVVF